MMPTLMTDAEKRVRTAHLRAEVCAPRGSHRPEMTKRFPVDGKPYIYRLCADCHDWVDPTPVMAQGTVRGAVTVASTMKSDPARAAAAVKVLTDSLYPVAR